MLLVIFGTYQYHFNFSPSGAVTINEVINKYNFFQLYGNIILSTKEREKEEGGEREEGERRGRKGGREEGGRGREGGGREEGGKEEGEKEGER